MYLPKDKKMEWYLDIFSDIELDMHSNIDYLYAIFQLFPLLFTYASIDSLWDFLGANIDLNGLF